MSLFYFILFFEKAHSPSSVKVLQGEGGGGCGGWEGRFSFDFHKVIFLLSYIHAVIFLSNCEKRPTQNIKIPVKCPVPFTAHKKPFSS